MIHLTIDAAITLYFVLIVIMIFVSWILYLIRHKKRQPLSFATKVICCEYCTVSYLERTSVKMPRCPTCGSYNK